MNTILSILLLLLILCIIIVFHEFGHFITAKKSGVYVYEFSLGFGPKIWSFKRKNDETEYCIRCIPLGGYVSMAGETNSQEEQIKLRDDQRLINKGFWTRMFVLLAGIINNFILAIVILFVSACIFGAPETRPIIGDVLEDSVAYNAGITKGDFVYSINDKKIKTLEDLSLELTLVDKTKEVKFGLKDENGEKREVTVLASVSEKDDKKVYTFGFSSSREKSYGFVSSIKYTYHKFISLLGSMGKTLAYIFNGRVKVSDLSGPVGIYTVVDQAKSTGIENILYLIAFLSVNVGVVNLLPIPVFDGGRAVLTVVEKAKGSKISSKVENILDLIGFALMILLMVYVTISDILKLI